LCRNLSRIKRDKAGSDTEFGTKVSASLVDVYGFVDRVRWENFNECLDFQDQAYPYRIRFGVSPETRHAEKNGSQGKKEAMLYKDIKIIIIFLLRWRVAPAFHGDWGTL